jgi:hypothetical protein
MGGEKMGEKVTAMRDLVDIIRPGTPDDRERIEIATAAFVHGMKIQLENAKKAQTAHTAPPAVYKKATA